MLVDLPVCHQATIKKLHEIFRAKDSTEHHPFSWAAVQTLVHDMKQKPPTDAELLEFYKYHQHIVTSNGDASYAWMAELLLTLVQAGGSTVQVAILAAAQGFLTETIQEACRKKSIPIEVTGFDLFPQTLGTLPVNEFNQLDRPQSADFFFARFV
jgi:hypothetical protein